MFKKVLAASLFSTALSLSVGSSASHAENLEAGSGPNPFSECGIGAALFPNTTWAAVSSNIIWDLGLTGLTSATASPETCKGKNIDTAQFIIDNYDNLAEETARGEGQHIAAMLNLQGCAAAAQPALTHSIRQGMSTIVGQEGYATQSLLEKSSSYYNVMTGAIAQNSLSCNI